MERQILSGSGEVVFSRSEGESSQLEPKGAGFMAIAFEERERIASAQHKGRRLS